MAESAGGGHSSHGGTHGAKNAPVAASVPPGSSVRPGQKSGLHDETPGLLKYADFDYAAFFRRRNVRVLIALVIVVVAIGFAYWLRSIFIPLMVALLLAYILNPVVEWVQRRGLTRRMAVLTVFIGFLAAAGGVVALAVPPVIENSKSVVDFMEHPEGTPAELAADVKPGDDGKAVPHGETTAPNAIGLAIDSWRSNAGIPSDFKPTRTEVRDWLKKVVKSPTVSDATDALGVFFNVSLFIILVPMFTFYFLLGLDRIWDRITEYLPGRHRDRILGILSEIHVMVSAFFRGRLTICVMIAAATVGLFVAFGVPYGVVLGLLGGFGVIIPFFSMIASLAPAVILMLLSTNASGVEVAIMAGLFLVIQGVEQFVLTPKILGKAVQLHPVTIIVGIFCMASLFGFFGALLAVPLTAIAKILGREFLLPYFRALASEPGSEGNAPPGAPPSASSHHGG